jgi:hypothetical protein
MSLIARLIEAGTPADLIEEVALLVAEKRTADARRAKDAARKREERAIVSTDIHGHPGHDGTSGTGADDPSLSRPPNENNSNPPTHTHPDINTTRARTDPFPRPDWADSQHWTDLKANRKAKRLPNTPSAYAKFLRDIEKWVDAEWPPGRLLGAIAARGWASAEHDPRDHTSSRKFNDGRQFRGSGFSGPDKRSGLARAIDDQLGTLRAFP